MKIHLRDIRMYNNAGMNFPVCRTQDRLLDLEASRYTMANREDYRNADDKSVFCKHCLRMWNERYGDWAPIKIEE